MRFLLILILLLSSHAPAYSEHEDEVINREVNEIIQLAIDSPELQQYFHINTLPNRSPLIVELPKDLQTIRLENVNKFGVPVVKSISNVTGPVFQISNYEVTSTAVYFDAAYNVEGIRLSYVFEKTGENWEIRSTKIAEE